MSRNSKEGGRADVPDPDLGGAGDPQSLLSEVKALRRRVEELEASAAEQARGDAQWHSYLELSQVISRDGFELTTVLDQHAIVTWMSPNHERIIGEQSRALLNARFFDFIHPDDRERMSLAFDYVMRTGNANHGSLRISDTKGGFHHLEGSMLRFTNREGEPRIVTVTRNVGAQVEAVQALEHAKRDLEEVVAKRTAELRSANARLRLFFDLSPLGIAIAEPPTRGFVRNVAYSKITGYSVEEVDAMDWTELAHPEDRTSMQEEFAAAVAIGKSSFSFEARLIGKQGQVIEIRNTAGLHRTADGKVDCLVSICEDIGNQKRVEREMRASELRYRAVAESAFDIVGEQDAAGNIVYLSESANDVLGYDQEQYARLDGASQVHPDDLAHVTAVLGGMDETGSSGTFLYRHRHRDGDWRWLESSGIHYTTPTGERHSVFSSRDVTRRHEMEAELRSRADFMDGIIDHMPVFLFRLDSTGVITQLLGSAMNPYPASADQIEGLSMFEFAPDSRSYVERALAGEHVYFEASGQRSGIPWSFVIYLSYDAAGAGGAIGFALNVTPIREAEMRLQQAQRLSALGTLAAGVAHEINNPIGSVMLAADYARSVLDAPDGREIVEGALTDIMREAKRCGEIVKSLLSYAGRDAASREIVDLNEVVLAASQLESKLSKEVGIEIVCDVSETPLWASLNRPGMMQVFANLIRNGLQSGDEGGRVDLATYRDSDTLRVVVSDNGRGMTPEELASIFDPFFTTRRARGGTGLGLALAEALISDHGGSIQVESGEGTGSRFVIELPGCAPP